jgi:hypothetical protein
MVVRDALVGAELVEQAEPRLRAVHHGHRHGVVQPPRRSGQRSRPRRSPCGAVHRRRRNRRPDPATTLDVTFTYSMGRVIRDYLRPE